MLTQKRKLLLSGINKIGALITSTEAHEMIENYHHQVPDGVGSFLYGRGLFAKLLSVPGCEGIRIVNAMYEGFHSLVLVAVNNHNQNILEYKISTPEGLITVNAPLAGKGALSPYCNIRETSRLVAEGAVNEAGTFITRPAAFDMIKTYQEQLPGTIKSNLYGREVYETLLTIAGCEGIRIFNGINKEGDHKFILVPVDALHHVIRNCQIVTDAGMSFVEDPIFNLGVPCPPICPEGRATIL